MAGSGHTEFKLVARKGKGGGAVPVRGIHPQGGHHAYAAFQHAHSPFLIILLALNGAQKLLQGVPQEHGDHRRGRFIAPQPLIVACTGHRRPQQILVFVHRLDNGGQKQQELQVVLRVLAGLQ